jgi:hypothetical protein
MLGKDVTALIPANRIGYFHALPRTMVCLLALLGWLALPVCGQDANTPATETPRYIGIEEIEPGMEGYCLTDYGQGGIERFPLRVVDVVHNIDPGHDAILVMGTDERFEHTGPVGGCSGSPVYFNDRLAGALAFGWSFSKDPLYGVTPIKEMLEVGRSNPALASRSTGSKMAFPFDFSEPIDLAAVSEQMAGRRLLAAGSAGAASLLPCPLLISGLSTEASQLVADQFEAMGFMAVPGLAGTATGREEGLNELKPGGTITVPLVTGDIRLHVLGTVTEVVDDRVYAFGHSFLGYGALDLPMAGGKVYTVISSMMRSFKLGTSGEILGALTTDEYPAVSGRIGAKPKTVPLSIRVERYNDPSPRTYECQVAYNDSLTSQLVRSALSGAALQMGSLPPEHTLEYEASIELADGQSIRFANLSTDSGLLDLVAEVSGALALLMNNPYHSPDIVGLDFAVRMRAENRGAHLWAVNINDTKVKPGENIEIDVIVESYAGQKKRYQLTVPVPEDLAAGKYGLMVCGNREYERFLSKAVPHRFLATNYGTLVSALNMALNISRTELYCVLALPSNGITLDTAELPDLPETKAVFLQSDKRAVRVQPFPHWVEKTLETGTVIAGKEVVAIEVEE